ncbi:unnamed protein product [Clonostachys rosea]|uniref:NACHT domain-containing protein n=1 Tax=Bionectria ochroleuca TaxID=29856 RepID=A0ABY6TU07_BIOOC|nr:unnamed protein product [Clonostachys rosea]
MALSTRRSAPAQQIIQTAFEELQNILSASDHASLQDTTLEDVRQAAYQIETQLRARKRFLNMRRLMPLLSGLEDFSGSIGILCTGTPYLPWLWSPIKLILKVASSNVEAMEKIIKGYSQIAGPLARFRMLNQTFSNNPQFQHVLALFYADIVSFHKEAYQFVRRSDWELFFMTSWGRFQRRHDRLLEDLEEHERLVDKTAAAINASNVEDIKVNLDELRRENLEKLARDEEEQTAGQYLSLKNLLNTDESEQLKIFDGISDGATIDGGVSDNGWLLKHPKIQSWIRPKQETTFLILDGSPGSGKSVLATHLAAFLRAHGQSLVISHFCTYTFPSSTLYENVLRSILIQIIRSDVDLIAYIYDQLVLKKHPAKVQLLEQLVRACVAAGSRIPSQDRFIHLIFDGLDECNISEQKKVIKMMERIVASAGLSTHTKTVCKILVLSSASETISRRARNKEFIHLSDEKDSMERSIRCFAQSRLNRIRSELTQIGITDTQISEMAIRIAKKAEGMFLWAKLVLDYLENNIFYTRDEILGAVDKLPRKLSEFYSQILMQMTVNFDTQSKERLRSILGWIAFSKYPLRKTELRSALAFASGNPDIKELPPQFIFDKCKPLVEHRPDSTYAFIHSSVRDYLLSSDSGHLLDESSIASEHGLATSACLLSGLRTFDDEHCDLSERVSRLVEGIHAFHIYSTKYWAQYILSAVVSDRTKFSKTQFFQNSILVSERLSSRRNTNHELIHNFETNALDEGLSNIRQMNETLHGVISETIHNQKDLALNPDLFIREFVNTHDLVPINSLQSLLENYQKTLKYVLSIKGIRGVSLQDIEKFKQDFGTDAYTCFIWTCSFATLGFRSEKLLREHEASHKRIVCNVSMCQYPPFSSNHALKAHLEKTHNQSGQGLRRPRIRRDSKKMSLSQNQKDISHETRDTPQQQSKPAMPVLVCREPQSTDSFIGYTNKSELHKNTKKEYMHFMDEEDHIVKQDLAAALGLDHDDRVIPDQKRTHKNDAIPKERSIQYMQRTNSIALGLEPDGCLERDHKQAVPLQTTSTAQQAYIQTCSTIKMNYIQFIRDIDCHNILFSDDGSQLALSLRDRVAIYHQQDRDYTFSPADVIMIPEPLMIRNVAFRPLNGNLVIVTSYFGLSSNPRWERVSTYFVVHSRNSTRCFGMRQPQLDEDQRYYLPKNKGANHHCD